MELHLTDRPSAAPVVEPRAPRTYRWPLVWSAVAGYLILATVIGTIGLLLTGPFEESTNRFDHAITNWFVDQRGFVGESIPGAISPLADTTIIVIGALGFAVASLAASRWRPVYVLAVGLTVELAVFLTINTLIDRPRPDVEQLGSVPSTASYPSGHSAAAAVLYLTFAMTLTQALHARWQRRVVWTVGALLPLAIGLSRVYRGLHHPTDVLAGWLLGVGCLIVTASAVALIEPRRRAHAV